MKLCLNYIFIIIFSSNIFGSTNSINNIDYRFKKIGIEQGLSQSSVLSIVQDRRGYMWFGTATGLNRYDGYEFVVYVNDLNDGSSISDNEITSLFEDDNGVLWIGTSKGFLNKFDSKTEKFEHYDIANSSDWFSFTEEELENYPLTFSRNNNSTITSITEDFNGNLWIGTWGKGIVKFNTVTKKKKYFYHFKNKTNTLSSNKIIKLLIDRSGLLWVGSFGGGLSRIKINLEGENDVFIENFIQESNYSIGDKITSIYEDSNENLWLGSYNGGVSLIKSENKDKISSKVEYTRLGNLLKTKGGSKSINVMSITEDHNSVIWIATYGDGLFSYSTKSKLFRNFVNESSDPTSLSENELQSLYVDNSGILWIGTQLGSGINKLEIGIHKFNSLPVLTEKYKSLNDNIIWAIHEDKDANIWIGTLRGGINKWDRKTNKFEYFTKNKNLVDNHIRCIAEDYKGNLWFGTYSGGLSFYNKKTSSFQKISTDKILTSSINSNQIQALLFDGDSLLWAGTFGNGLDKLNLKEFYKNGKAEFTHFTHEPTIINSISDNRVYTLFKDSKNILWVGTHGGGLNKFDTKTNTFAHFKYQEDRKNTISNDRVLSINEMVDGNLLIGTFGGGLSLFVRDKNSFERINERLPINCSDVYGILSSGGSYWISTNNGIIKFDSNLKSFQTFNLSDGLQSLEFSGGAYFKGKDGTCYFGGINGMNFFNPADIKLDDYVPPIVISRVRIFDKLVKGENESLVLGRDENYFSFEFASLDFKNSTKNKYKFIMEGLDKQWSYTDAENRKVFYTNLAPGNYSFRVLGTNNDGIWSPREAKIDITILAPFWVSWWFISAIILFFGAIITFFISQRIKYLVALDKLKTNIAADLHDNVGAGLTEISILSELAANELNKQSTATKQLGLISDLSRQLVESMSDIVWVVNPNRDSLYDLIVRLKDMLGEILSNLGINLRTSNLDELSKIKLPMDYRQNLYLILKEAINNSIKHSNCENIDINTTIHKNILSIKIVDDGIGFDPDNIVMGNGLINIKKRASRIGNVNISTNSDKGTSIEFEGKIK